MPGLPSFLIESVERSPIQVKVSNCNERIVRISDWREKINFNTTLAISAAFIFRFYDLLPIVVGEVL